MDALRPLVVEIIKKHQAEPGGANNADDLADEVMAAVAANLKPYQYNAELIRVLMGFLEEAHFTDAAKRQTRMLHILLAFMAVWTVWQIVIFVLLR